MPATVALLVLALVYWGIAALLPVWISAFTSTALFVLLLGACLLALRQQVLQWSARLWAYLAMCCMLTAGFLWGAEFALDALHGASRPKTNIAASLGGLELWFVFLPGLTALCLGCSAGVLLKARAVQHQENAA